MAQGILACQVATTAPLHHYRQACSVMLTATTHVQNCSTNCDAIRKITAAIMHVAKAARKPLHVMRCCRLRRSMGGLKLQRAFYFWRALAPYLSSMRRAMATLHGHTRLRVLRAAWAAWSYRVEYSRVARKVGQG